MDILTQLQTSLDELLAQYYASLHYINQHHSSSSVSGTNNPFGHNPSPFPATAPSTANPAPPPATAVNTTIGSPSPNQTQEQQQSDPSLPPNHRPESPTTFRAAQRELAHDLILKYQQIKLLIRNLPGVERSEENQGERLRALDEELRGALREREEVEDERRAVLRAVEGVLGGVRR